MVEVAFVDVAFVKTPVDGVVAPIGVLSITPPLMVRLSATCASVAVPTKLAKLIPSDEVESCWYVPPAYDPRRIPAAEGFEIPVPPPPAVKSPASVLANVSVFPELVMVVLAVSPLNAVDEVAKVSAPVSVFPGMAIEATPLLIDEVATQVGTPPLIARTKPPVDAAMDESVSAEVVYRSEFVPPNVFSPVPPDATGTGLPKVGVPLVSNERKATDEVAPVAAEEVAKYRF